MRRRRALLARFQRPRRNAYAPAVLVTPFSTLEEFIERHRKLFILTGAGCSTRSGIPDYRDADGAWKRAQPIRYQDFMADAAARRRYWARSLIGWRRFREARPNDAHRALARLESKDRIELLLTQNVDRLHQAAGSVRVVDLHGLRAQNRARRSPGRAWPAERRLAGTGRRRCAGRRRRSRRRRLLLVRAAVMPPLRRRPQAGRRLLRRDGPARPRRRGHATFGASRRDADCRLLADGLFRLPLRSNSRFGRKARSRDQSRPDARRRAARAESGAGVRGRAGFSFVRDRVGGERVLSGQGPHALEALRRYMTIICSASASAMVVAIAWNLLTR